MRIRGRNGLWIWLAAAGLVPGCGKGADPAPPSPSARSTPARAPAPHSAASLSACALLTAEEVGAIFGRKVGSSGSGSSCEYGIAPDHASPRDQLLVNLEVSSRSPSEAEVKARYAGLGKDVHTALHPEQRGLPDAIAVGDDVPGVGDWAFAVNVASFNLGMGFTSRGRVLESQRGSVHLTVSATVAPDPGVPRLDASLGAVAKTAFSRISESAASKEGGP